MHNAECLSGIVFSQLIRETPVMYASSWTAYDMRSNMAVIGTPETHILRIAGAQMAAFTAFLLILQLPILIPIFTMSKTPGREPSALLFQHWPVTI